MKSATEKHLKMHNIMYKFGAKVCLNSRLHPTSINHLFMNSAFIVKLRLSELNLAKKNNGRQNFAIAAHATI